MSQHNVLYSQLILSLPYPNKSLEGKQSLSRAAMSVSAKKQLDILLAWVHPRSSSLRVAFPKVKMLGPTFLLAFLLLPKLKETGAKHTTRTNLTVVSSGLHAWTTIPEKSAPGELFAALSDEKTAVMHERYPVSKLLEVLVVREMEKTAAVDKYPVTINTVDPGLCHSELAREGGWAIYIIKLLFARSTEHGSWTLVHAATQGEDAHGKHLVDCQVVPTSEFSRSEEGEKLQKRVWRELTAKLETISPGITSNL